MKELLSLAFERVAGVARTHGMSVQLLAVTLVCGALVLPPLLIGLETRNSLSADMLDSHLPQINFFITHPWNFVDYPGYSASLPGHHILLAWAARLLGYSAIDSGTLPIRLLHAIFGCVFSLVVFVFIDRMQRSGRSPERYWVTAALWVSAVPSYYVVLSSIYISTDVPALTFYVCFLYLVTFAPAATTAIVASATALVYWRQSYAPVLAAPFFTSPRRLRDMLLSPMLLSLVVPGSVLLFYVIQFGGLAPVSAHGLTLGGLFPQSVLHAFAFLGVVLPVYLLIFGNLIGPAYRSSVTVVTAAALCLLVAAIWFSVPSTYDHAAGRWGSIVWRLSRLGPDVAGRSATVLLLGFAGAMFAALLVRLALDRWEVRSVVFGLVLYLVAQLPMPLAFQRYIEPMVLMLLGLVAAGFVTVATWRLVLFGAFFCVYSLIGLLRVYDALPSGWFNL